MVDVDICNLALSYLGDSATVASIDPPDGSIQAQHCARFYPMAVSLMLEAHDWNFITKRVSLALLTTPYPASEYRYAYAAPSDANTVISVIPRSRYAEESHDWRSWDRMFNFEDGNVYGRDFQIERDASNRQVILSNICDAVVRYTSTQAQPGMFTALFTDALAWKLASMLAGPLLKGDVGAAESKRCLQAFGVFLEQAKTQDANQQHEAPRPKPVWLRDR